MTPRKTSFVPERARTMSRKFVRDEATPTRAREEAAELSVVSFL
jgi:hypothetical protein